MSPFSDVAESLGTCLSTNMAFFATIYYTYTFLQELLRTFDVFFLSGSTIVRCLTGKKGLYIQRNALALRRFTSGFSVGGLAYVL